MGKEVVFYYDVVCPFAYMASRFVERLGQRTRATVHWRPVLLGGLYEATKAAQGKAGSSMDVMSPTKLKVVNQDLHRQFNRLSVPYHEPDHHPQRTVDAMRMLAAISDHSLRVSVSHALYKAYWYEGRDVSDHNVLEKVADQFGLNSSKLLASETASKKLRANTTEAAQRGAFGVPSFYTGSRLFWGTDRMFLVERALGVQDSGPERLVPAPSQPSSASLTFFFDYASPWSYIACERMAELVSSVAPVQVHVEWVPILLGALFKKIGTPLVPMSVLSEAKQRYVNIDLQDWSEYSGVEVNWPDVFPLRSVLPLRLTLAAKCDPTLIKVLHRAVWRDNMNIGNKEVLSKVVSKLDGQKYKLWLEEAESEKVKAELFANTSRALDLGVCGVPTFQVNGSSEIVWGQDRLNVVADQICGLHDAKL